VGTTEARKKAAGTEAWGGGKLRKQSSGSNHSEDQQGRDGMYKTVSGRKVSRSEHWEGEESLRKLAKNSVKQINWRDLSILTRRGVIVARVYGSGKRDLEVRISIICVWGEEGTIFGLYMGRGRLRA